MTSGSSARREARVRNCLRVERTFRDSSPSPAPSRPSSTIAARFIRHVVAVAEPVDRQRSRSRAEVALRQASTSCRCCCSCPIHHTRRRGRREGPGQGFPHTDRLSTPPRKGVIRSFHAYRPLVRDRGRADDADGVAERRGHDLDDPCGGPIASARTRSRTGPSSCSPSRLTPPPITTRSGSKTLAIDAMPHASASHVSAQTRSATASPARAAAATSAAVSTAAPPRARARRSTFRTRTPRGSRAGRSPCRGGRASRR